MASEKRVLIVDDHEEFLYLLQLALKKYGYDVTTSADPVAALELARSGSFTHFIVDVIMPKVDGIHFIRELRAMKIPGEIALISGYPAPEKAIEGYKAGIRVFIQKGGDSDIMVDQVRLFIESWK